MCLSRTCLLSHGIVFWGVRVERTGPTHPRFCAEDKSLCPCHVLVLDPNLQSRLAPRVSLCGVPCVCCSPRCFFSVCTCVLPYFGVFHYFRWHYASRRGVNRIKHTRTHTHTSSSLFCLPHYSMLDGKIVLVLRFRTSRCTLLCLWQDVVWCFGERRDGGRWLRGGRLRCWWMMPD